MDDYDQNIYEDFEDEFDDNELDELNEVVDDEVDDEVSDKKIYGGRVYETLKNPKKVLDEYQKYWLSVYGVDPTLPTAARLHREAKLRREGLKKIRDDQLTALEEKIQKRFRPETVQEKAALKIQKMFKCNCENLSISERKKMNPRFMIKLRIQKGSETKCLCYDIFKLYLHLITSYGKNDFDWKDPTTKKFFSKNQVKRIKEKWGSVTPCGTSANIIKLKVDLGKSDKVSIPVSLYDQYVRREDIKYLVSRFINQEGDYLYRVSEDFNKTTDTVLVPQSVLNSLKLNRGDPIYLEECFSIPKIDYVLLQPITPEWNSIPDSQLDTIKLLLEESMEKYTALMIGDPVVFDFNGTEIVLQVAELKSNNKFIPVGISKETEVNTEFLPLQF